MDMNKKIPTIPFVVAEDKIEDFLNADTGSIIDTINRIKEYRKSLIERAKKVDKDMK